METLMTSDELANYLRVDVVTIRRLVNRRELAAYRIGGEFRFMEPDIVDYLQRQHIPANESAIIEAVKFGPLAQLLQKIFPEGQDRFERFTKRARTAMNMASEEARTLQHNFIGTEHLLLGLLREGGGIAARSLTHFGLDLEQARQMVAQIVKPGVQDSEGRPGLTMRAHKVIELAINEAQSLGHRYIGTEHLLLGILREGEGVAALVLSQASITLEAIQLEIIRLLGEYIERPPIPPEAASLLSQGEMERICSNCNAHCPAYFRHCFNCGLFLPEASESSEPQGGESGEPQEGDETDS